MSIQANTRSHSPVPLRPQLLAGLAWTQSVMRLALALIFLLGLDVLIARAGEEPSGSLLDPGQVVVTGFAGTVLADSAGAQAGDAGKIDETFLDPDGAVMRIVDVGGVPTGGGREAGAAEAYAIIARDIGQVFGIAIDDRVNGATGRPAPNIYLGASSAYGLYIVAPDRDGDGWPKRIETGDPEAQFMEGQLGVGKGGDPGTVWKVDGITGDVTVFAKILDRGEPNSGPGLGNLSYDPATASLYVSDLDTGLLHRLDAEGKETGTYDHGLAGREAEGLPAFEDDVDDRADVTSPAFKTNDPTTWGFAAPPRRVWGLRAQGGRLYYAVAEGPEIWSVVLGQDGSFSEPRREIALPADIEPYEIADVSFTSQGWMILAQRPPVTGGYDYVTTVASGPARVLRYRPATEAEQAGGETIRWIVVPDEYAVGLKGDNRNTAGGVALGYGYKKDGGLDYSACEATLWTTGESLLQDQTRAIKVEKVPGFATSAIDGLQGTDITLVRPDNVPPENARFVDYDGKYVDNGYRGHLGDVEIPYHCAGAGAEPAWEPEYAVPYWKADYTSGLQSYPELDLAVEKYAVGACKAGGICRFEIRVVNRGKSVYYGPLVIGDTLSGSALTLVGSGPTPWGCSQVGSYLNCHRSAIYLKPGRSQSLWVSVRISSGWKSSSLKNCAAVNWLADETAKETIRAVQNELARRGYYAGAADGIAGPGTAAAISAYASDAGLAPAAQVDRDLIASLFGAGAWHDGDADPGNDEGCAVHEVEGVVTASKAYLISDAAADAPAYVPPIYYPKPRRCEPGYTPVGASCVKWCPPGTYLQGGRCLYDEPDEIVCHGARIAAPDGTCVCPRGTIEASYGIRTRCIVPEQIRCYGGEIYGGVCQCPSGYSRSSIGRRSFLCLPVPDLTCVNGYERRGRCECRRLNEYLVQIAPREYQCVPRQTGGPICYGGISRNGRCFCPDAKDAARLAAGIYRCVSDDSVRCVGGYGSKGRCVCDRGELPVRTGRNDWKCKDIDNGGGHDGIACIGGSARYGKCWCGSGRSAKRVGDGLYRCVKDDIVVVPLCKDGKAPRSISGVLRCPPGGQQTICIGGKLNEGRCTCDAGEKLQQLGSRRYRCIDGGGTGGNNPTVVCAGGAVRSGKCVCQGKDKPARVSDRLFRCPPGGSSGGDGDDLGQGGTQPSTTVVCSGGRLVGKRCLCGAKERLERIAAKQFRCVAKNTGGNSDDQQSGDGGQTSTPITCSGGRLAGKRCICGPRERLERDSDRAFRCVPKQPAGTDDGLGKETGDQSGDGGKAVTCVGGTARGNACICGADSKRVRVSARVFRCVEVKARGKEQTEPDSGNADNKGNKANNDAIAKQKIKKDKEEKKKKKDQPESNPAGNSDLNSGASNLAGTAKKLKKEKQPSDGVRKKDADKIKKKDKEKEQAGGCPAGQVKVGNICLTAQQAKALKQQLKARAQQKKSDSGQ